MANKVIFVGYEDKYGPHTVAVSTNAEKLLFFDSNEGLFQFQNLEILSLFCGKTMEGCKFHWLASFALPS